MAWRNRALSCDKKRSWSASSRLIRSSHQQLIAFGVSAAIVTVTLFNRLASAIALPLHLAKLPWIFATDPSSQLGVSDHHVARYCIRSYALSGFRGTRWATLAMRPALSAASGEIEYGCRCNVGARAEDRTCTQTSSCPRRIDRRPKTLALSDAKTQSCSLRSLAATTTDPSQPWALLLDSRVVRKCVLRCVLCVHTLCTYNGPTPNSIVILLRMTGHRPSQCAHLSV